jgi:hypothetical protein
MVHAGLLGLGSSLQPPHTHLEQLCSGDEPPAPAAASGPRPAPVHLVPYSQAAPLAGLPPGDVAAVLEVLLGRAGGGAAPSAVSGRWDEEAPEAHWVPPPCTKVRSMSSGLPSS